MSADDKPLPFDSSASGVYNAKHCSGDFRTDAITRNERYSMRHAWSFMTHDLFVKFSCSTNV